MSKTDWIICPICGRKIHNKIRKNTVLKNCPLYCPKRAENAHQRKGFADNRHPKAGTLIKLCKPPIMVTP